MIKLKNPLNYLNFFKSFVNKNFLFEINYYIFSILISLTIWARQLPIDFIGFNKSSYSFILIYIDFFWLIVNLYFLIKERKLLFKINNFILFSLIYTGIFALNFSTRIFKDDINDFNFFKLIAFIFISTFISEINIDRFKRILYRSGILSFFIYVFIYLKQIIITKGEIFDSYNARLNLGNFNPNSIAYGLLITLLLLTIRSSNSYKLPTRITIILCNTFLIINLIQTQSRSIFIIFLINLSIIIFYRFKENLELFISLSLSFIHLFFLDNLRTISSQSHNLNPSNQSKSIYIFTQKMLNIYNDSGSGRLEIWTKCYDALPSRIAEKILNKVPYKHYADWDKVSSHNVLIDIFTTNSPSLLKIYYFISIYLLYGYFFLISIYKKNILSLNLTIATTFTTFFHNSLRDPINLLLIPIIFTLSKEPKTKKC